MLTKTLPTLEGVEAKYHILYTLGTDGVYTLDASLIGDTVPPEGDTSGLKATNAALKQEKQALQARLAALEEANQSREEDGLAASKEYEKLLQLKMQQFEARNAPAEEKATKAIETLKTTMIGAAVNEMANLLAGDAALLLYPHLKDRVTVNDSYELIFTDPFGNASALTKEQLMEEFKQNKLFSKVIQGRQSSGGGSFGGGGSGEGDVSEYAKFFNPASGEYNLTKQGDIQDSHPDIYKALTAKYDLGSPYENIGTARPRV
ncbi:MAG: hypothetical protein JHC33_05360 [Ignisphaera sp.]|nr:hypothetical protein [Ignisphaera sp.]